LPEHAAWMRSQTMRSLGAHDAYIAALMRDTFDAYTDFLADYWHDPMTKRVRALLAVRREAITWQRSYQANVPDAYWSYLERYPRGPHVADARRLLAHLGATVAPSSKFATMEFDVAPPLRDELEYLEAVLVFDDPTLAFEPPLASPLDLLGLPPKYLALAPAAPSGAYRLPAITASISPPTALEVLDGPRLPPSVLTKATLIDSRSPPPSIPVPREKIDVPPGPSISAVTPFWAILDPAQEVIKADLSRPLPAASLTPLWATLDPSSQEASYFLPMESLPPLAPTNPDASASLAIEPPSLERDDTPPIVVPTTLAPLPTGTPLSTRRKGTPSSLTTGSIPLPASRPAIFAPPPTAAPTKPVSRAASVSAPIGAAQAKQPHAPPLKRLVPSADLAHPPKAATGVSAPKP